MNTELRNSLGGLRGHQFFSWMLVIGQIIFVLSSYPMMYQGYDIHWLLDSIRDLSMHENNKWQSVWAVFFEVIGLGESKALRALVIHRTQSLITFILIGSSAYLFLDVALKKTDKHLKLQLASVSVVVWLTMHGTYSSPSGEPHYTARHVLSWLQWYSVSYQITLPLFFYGCASLLKGVTADNARLTMKWCLVTLVVAGVIAIFHAAELVYFLFVASGILFLYVLPNNNWRTSLLVVVLLVALFILGLNFSYRKPEVFRLLHPDRWADLSSILQQYGYRLVELNLIRSETTWHSMYSGSFLSASLVVLIGQGAQRKLSFLVLYSAILAITIHISYVAGFLALIVGEFVTWRFGFSSLLYLGFPLLVGAMLERIRMPIAPFYTSLLAIGALVGILFFCIAYSFIYEPLQPAFNFAKSLLFSLSPELSYFPSLQ
ncbi:hypothetical protein [Hydrogenophaga sp.]|uniref:hypothetical protein n=1 Tax=Hydrogenophaga sp. TaxID=1904254 RepID=UPI0035AE10B4